MRLALAERAPVRRWRSRTVGSEDVPDVGALMLAAYRGTEDDEGETESDAVAEVERTIEGEYGPFLKDCSFVVEDDGRIVGASMVNLFDGQPFLTYVVVHPEMQGRGIGTSLIAATGEALRSAGHARMDLFVTESNEPAVNLYEKLGFEVVDRITEPG